MAENEWTDELKEEVVSAYKAADPTPENTMDIVKQLAEQFSKTPNGVRMVLTRASVYIKKSPTTTTASSSNSEGSKRVNKAVAISNLKKKISNLGQNVDDDICDRLTGKAAVYILEIIEAIG